MTKPITSASIITLGTVVQHRLNGKKYLIWHSYFDSTFHFLIFRMIRVGGAMNDDISFFKIVKDIEYKDLSVLYEIETSE